MHSKRQHATGELLRQKPPSSLTLSKQNFSSNSKPRSAASSSLKDSPTFTRKAGDVIKGIKASMLPELAEEDLEVQDESLRESLGAGNRRATKTPVRSRAQASISNAENQYLNSLRDRAHTMVFNEFPRNVPQVKKVISNRKTPSPRKLMRIRTKVDKHLEDFYNSIKDQHLRNLKCYGKIRGKSTSERKNEFVNQFKFHLQEILKKIEDN